MQQYILADLSAPRRNRTPSLLLRRQPLYPLSYGRGEPLYDMARTYFKQSFSNTSTGRSGTNRGDSSRDIAPARTAPAVLLPGMTNADQPEQETKPNHNQGVVYQAKPLNPGCFGSPGRRWRPVDYAGNHQRFRPEPDNQPNQLTGKLETGNNR